jgi:hypothetical protein
MHFLLPYVRIELLIHTMLTRTWAPEAWPLVKLYENSDTKSDNSSLGAWKASISEFQPRELVSEPCWTRTSDPLIKSQVLYHLS